MTIIINAQGAERKRLAQSISKWLGCKAKYCGTPTFNYEIGCFTVDKSGNLSFDNSIDNKIIEGLLKHICDEGFDIDRSHTEELVEDEPYGICISMPRSLFTDCNLENLKALITYNGSLIKKALDLDDLPLEITATEISFPWFSTTPSSEKLKAYETFICKLCETFRDQRRITEKEKYTENEKHAFRCFLIRLGFIGDEYKMERKILLRNLTDSSPLK